MNSEPTQDPDDRARRDLHQRLKHALSYENPADRQRPDAVQGVGWNFLIGLSLGVLVSAVVWFTGWDSIKHGPWIDYLFWALPIGKVMGAIAIIFVPRWRGFGIGLLVSIPIGALIFVVSCAVNFKM